MYLGQEGFTTSFPNGNQKQSCRNKCSYTGVKAQNSDYRAKEDHVLFSESLQSIFLPHSLISQAHLVF